MNPRELRLPHAYLLYDATIVSDPHALSFNPRELAARGALVGETCGRGRTYFIKIDGNDCVLRHYRRGGMMAGILRDNYLWTGIARTRAWKEWHILRKLFESGLPVPRPVAARIIRARLAYKADLITMRLHGTCALAQALAERALPDDAWKAIGACIRRFHDAGVCHGDLNAHNILLDQAQTVYLIDFDNSSLYNATTERRERNLARLQRSLAKLRSLSERFYYSEQVWLLLCAGYGAGASKH